MQQINLYRPEFQPNREPLRSIHILWSAMVFLALLIIFSLFSMNTNKKQRLALEQERVQLTQLTTQVTQLEQGRPQANLAELDGQILELTQELSRRNQIFSIIANKNIGNNSGFSAHLQALGRQSLDTLSLTVFSLQQGGNYAEFVGKTRAPDQIPLYIQRLRSEPIFAESAFGVLNLTSTKNEQDVFDFSVAKQTQESNSGSDSKTAVQMAIDAKTAINDAKIRSTYAKTRSAE